MRGLTRGDDASQRPDSYAVPDHLPATRDEIGALVARLSGADDSDRSGRAGQLGRLAALLAGSAKRAGARAVASGRWLGDVILDTAPRIPVRDVVTLRAHYGGLAGDDLATALVAAACRNTAAVGAAGGALATVEFAALPTLLSAPVQLAAETLAVVAVEVKLLAELHEVYGRPAVGTGRERATAYVVAWSRRRGIDPFGGGPGLRGVVSHTASRELRQRLVRRFGLNVTTLAPMFAGAVAGAGFNRRETRKLAERVVADLGGRLR